MAEDSWKEVEGIILSQSAEGVRKVDPRQVVTAEWVRLRCQYGCGGYGQCLTCPPYSATPEQTRKVLDAYSVGFLIYWGHEGGGRKALAVLGVAIGGVILADLTHMFYYWLLHKVAVLLAILVGLCLLAWAGSSVWRKLKGQGEEELEVGEDQADEGE